MLCYYINLDRRPDRRAAIEAQLDAAGVTAERISAVTAETVPPELARRWCAPHRPQGLSLPVLACSLSHHTAWQLLLDTTEPMALVLEDDATLSPHLSTTLTELRLHPASFDIVRLETRDAPILLDRHSHISLAEASAHLMHSNASGTAGYVISRAAAEKLLAADSLLGVPVDHAMLHKALRPVEPLQLVPALVSAPAAENGRDSDLDPHRQPQGTRLRKLFGRTRRAVQFFMRVVVSGGTLFVSRAPFRT